MDMLLHGRKGIFDRIWKKPLEEARTIKREPMIVMKQNNRPVLVMTTDKGRKLLLSGVVAGQSAPFPCRGFFPLYGAYVYLFRDLICDVDFSRLRDKYEQIEPRTKKIKPILGGRRVLSPEAIARIDGGASARIS
jgi:hypothetical protein